MKLKQCSNNHEKVYTLKSTCSICNQPAQDAHYKFIKLRDVKPKATSDKLNEFSQ